MPINGFKLPTITMDRKRIGLAVLLVLLGLALIVACIAVLSTSGHRNKVVKKQQQPSVRRNVIVHRGEEETSDVDIVAIGGINTKKKEKKKVKEILDKAKKADKTAKEIAKKKKKTKKVEERIQKTRKKIEDRMKATRRRIDDRMRKASANMNSRRTSANSRRGSSGGGGRSSGGRRGKREAAAPFEASRAEDGVCARRLGENAVIWCGRKESDDDGSLFLSFRRSPMTRAKCLEECAKGLDVCTFESRSGTCGMFPSCSLTSPPANEWTHVEEVHAEVLVDVKACRGTELKLIDKIL